MARSVRFLLPKVTDSMDITFKESVVQSAVFVTGGTLTTVIPELLLVVVV
jgi:hypothetical protein